MTGNSHAYNNVDPVLGPKESPLHSRRVRDDQPSSHRPGRRLQPYRHRPWTTRPSWTPCVRCPHSGSGPSRTAGHVSKGPPMNRRRLDPPPFKDHRDASPTGSHTPRRLTCFMVPQEPAPMEIKRTIRLFATSSTPVTAPSPAPSPTCGPLCAKAFSHSPLVVFTSSPRL